MDVQKSDMFQPAVPSTSLQPPPYTAQDAKEFQEKEKMQEEACKDVTFANVNLTKNEGVVDEVKEGEESCGTKTVEPNEYALMFSEKSIRRAFCRKVFSLLSILLLKTVVYCAICTYVTPVRQFWSENLLHIFWGMPVYLASVFIIICCPSIRQRSPWNYILLFLFSSSLTFMVGGICSIYQEEVVMIAFAMTTGLVLGLAWFAFQTRWDFTACGMLVFSLAFVLGITTAMSLAYLNIGGRIALSGLAIFIFSICLVIDIQYIIDGDHRYKISPEEHIFAVTILYLDIINILLLILRAIR